MSEGRLAGLTPWEIQLHTDAIGIVEKELRNAARGTMLSRNFTLLDCKRLRAVDIARGKRDVVEPVCIVAFFSVPRTTYPRGLRVPIRCTVRRCRNRASSPGSRAAGVAVLHPSTS